MKIKSVPRLNNSEDFIEFVKIKFKDFDKLDCMPLHSKVNRNWFELNWIEKMIKNDKK